MLKIIPSIRAGGKGNCSALLKRGLDWISTAGTWLRSKSLLTKLLYIPSCDGKELDISFLHHGHGLHGRLYVLEGGEYRLDRFIYLEYLGGTDLDFYGNSYAFPMLIGSTGVVDHSGSSGTGLCSG